MEGGRGLLAQTIRGFSPGPRAARRPAAARPSDLRGRAPGAGAEPLSRLRAQTPECQTRLHDLHDLARRLQCVVAPVDGSGRYRGGSPGRRPHDVRREKPGRPLCQPVGRPKPHPAKSDVRRLSGCPSSNHSKRLRASTISVWGSDPEVERASGSESRAADQCDVQRRPLAKPAAFRRPESRGRQ